MKVVYFDYWTGGIHNFVPLDKELKKLNHETMLFHIGSFNEHVEVKEKIGDIECFDISYFDTKFIYKALEKIKPDVVISLNTTYIFDRVLVQSCKLLGIKTIFMMHGIRATGTNLKDSIVQMEKSYGGIYKKIAKASKYFSTVIPNYIFSSYKFNILEFLKLRFLRVLIDYFLNTGRAFYFPSYSIELLHDKCLVYAIKYIDYYKQVGYREEQIFVVGDPKQDTLFARIANKDFCITNLPQKIQELIENNHKYAIYLEDSFVESNNLFGWTKEDRNYQISEIANRLKHDGIKLVLKVHPTTCISCININSDNCIVVEKIDLESLIWHSFFCIAHISSTVNIAVLMQKPVVVPQWGKSAYVTDYFISNGIGNPWASLNDNLNLQINKESRELYIETDICIDTSNSLNLIIKEILN